LLDFAKEIIFLSGTPSKITFKPLPQAEPKNNPTEFQKLPATGKMETYNFVINGVAVTVSGRAKNVHIAPDSMVVNF